MKYRFLSILFLYHVFLKCDHKFLSSISRIFLKVTQQANFFLTSQFFQTLKMHIWTPLVVQWNVHFHCRRTQVQSLTEESRSHMLHSAGKKKALKNIGSLLFFIEYGYLYMENYFYFSNQVVSVGACFAHYNKIV